MNDSERDALRTRPVGSAGWSKNRLVDSGAYRSTTLTAAVDPTDQFAFVLAVADPTKLDRGVHVRIGTGSNAESAVIETVSTSDNTVVLSESLTYAHGAGVTVKILPSTLLAAIRAVRINFTAILGQLQR